MPLITLRPSTRCYARMDYSFAIRCHHYRLPPVVDSCQGHKDWAETTLSDGFSAWHLFLRYFLALFSWQDHKDSIGGMFLLSVVLVLRSFLDKGHKYSIAALLSDGLFLLLSGSCVLVFSISPQGLYWGVVRGWLVPSQYDITLLRPFLHRATRIVLRSYSGMACSLSVWCHSFASFSRQRHKDYIYRLFLLRIMSLFCVIFA